MVQPDTSIDQVLSSIDGKWDAIQVYDPLDGTDHWRTNNTYRPDQLNDLQSLDRTMGFWINITEADVNLSVWGMPPTTTNIQLYAGWNLVGYPTLNNTLKVSEAFFGTAADRVEVFDPAQPYNLIEAPPTYIMQPGEGYWVRVPMDTVWTVDW
jgi:hypothetical protein